MDRQKREHDEEDEIHWQSTIKWRKCLLNMNEDELKQQRPERDND